jgi:polyhydroxybutyrate depolymerase
MKALAMALSALVAAGAHAALPAGNHRIAMQAGGLDRSYIVHMPPRVRGAPAVVLNIHGGGGNAGSHQKYVRMDPLADREGFIVVYPDGTGRLKEKLLTWNAGTCCGSAASGNVDDVAFVAALLDDLAARTDYDRARIYATGFSNGAMMAYRLAVDLPDRIAAVAPVAGAMSVKTFAPRRPVPIMHIHSVDDPRALYQGGLGPPFPFTTARVQHPPVEGSIDRWVEFEDCSRAPAEGDLREWHADKGVHTAVRYVFSGCRGGSEIALWKLSGSGHVWPGGTRDYLTHWLGPSTHVVDANVEMWKFFSRFALKP